MMSILFGFVPRQILLVIHECNTEWYVVFAAVLFKLVCGIDVTWSRYLLLNPACSLGWFASNFFSSLVVMICVNVHIISTIFDASLGVLFSFISLSFFITALVGDTVIGLFCFLFCFAMPVAPFYHFSHVLFRVYVSLSSSNSANLFLSLSWNASFFVPIIGVSTLVCVFSFRSILHSAQVFSLTEPITILCEMLTRLIYDGHIGRPRPKHARSAMAVMVYSISVFVCFTRASPCPSPPCFLLQLCVHDLEFIDVAHSTRVSPLSFRWPRSKHPVVLSDVFVSPTTLVLKSPITIA